MSSPSAPDSSRRAGALALVRVAAGGVFVFLVAHLTGRVLRWPGRGYYWADDVYS